MKAHVIAAVLISCSALGFAIAAFALTLVMLLHQ